MSAAHCFKDVERAKIRFTNRDMRTVSENDVTCHEDYNYEEKAAQYDICVIKVGVPVSINPLGLRERRLRRRLEAVGIDTSRGYYYKKFYERITKLTAQNWYCPNEHVICTAIQEGNAISSYGDSGENYLLLYMYVFISSPIHFQVLHFLKRDMP